MIYINADIDRAETWINQVVQKDIIALVSKSQQSSAANGCGPRVVISSEALRIKSHKGTEYQWARFVIGGDAMTSFILAEFCTQWHFLKQVYIVQFCSEALRGRWLYSPSEALSALGRAWKVIHNEGVWGGGRLAVVGSIHWDESNINPIQLSLFPLHFLRMFNSFWWLKWAWRCTEAVSQNNTPHLQHSTRTPVPMKLLSSSIQNNIKDHSNSELWLDVTVKAKQL